MEKTSPFPSQNSFSVPGTPDIKEVLHDEPYISPFEDREFGGRGIIVMAGAWTSDKKSVTSVRTLFRRLGLSYKMIVEGSSVSDERGEHLGLMTHMHSRVRDGENFFWGTLRQWASETGASFAEIPSPRKKGDPFFDLDKGEPCVHIWLGPQLPPEEIDDPAAAPPVIGEVSIPKRHPTRANVFYYADLRDGVIYLERRLEWNRRTGVWDRGLHEFEPAMDSKDDKLWINAEDARALAKLLNDAADELDSRTPSGEPERKE